MTTPRTSHHTRLWWGWERGSTTIQMAALMPVLFLIMFTGLQAALYYNAATVAAAAAQDGARAAAAYTGDLTAGVAVAQVALAQSHGAVTGYTVTTASTAQFVTVTISGEALSVIPGMRFPLSQSADWPWERTS